MKAIIPAAGFGSRFLPLTKAQPKEMLPVVNKPTIQWVVEEAVDAGITLFDTADLYGENGSSETYLGKALKGHRDQVVIATKFGGPMGKLPMQKGGSRQHVFQSEII